MNAIKKILSVSLAVIMLLSLSAVGFTAYADTAVGETEDVFVDLYPTTDDEYPDMEFDTVLIGDVDCDYRLTVKDATLIQKYVALLIDFSDVQEFYADVDGDERVVVKDATAIQKAVALLTDGVPMQPLFNYEGKNIESTILTFGSLLINFNVTDAGWYSVITTYDEAEYYVNTVIFDDDLFPVADGADIFVYLEPGDYIIIVDNYEGCEIDVEVSITYFDEFDLFDPEAAIEVDTTCDELTAGDGPWVYKVQGVATNDSMLIYTEGNDPKLSMQIFDSNLSKYNIFDYHYDDMSNLMSIEDLSSEYSEYYYIVISQEDTGSDFTLYLGAVSKLLKDYAVDLEPNKTITVPTRYVEADQDDFTYAFSAVSSIYRFTPDKDGYHVFSLSSEVMGVVEFILINNSVENSDSPYGEVIRVDSFDVYGPLEGSVSEYLSAGSEYYVLLVGALVSDSNMYISVERPDDYCTPDEEITSPDEEYPDSTFDEISEDCEAIAVGDTREVELTSLADVKWFKLTAQEDMQIVVTSTGSKDAVLIVYNADGEVIGLCDDMGAPYNSFDFAALGSIVAGEEYYFCIGSYEVSEDVSDMFTVTVVDSKDYEI